MKLARLFRLSVGLGAAWVAMAPMHAAEVRSEAASAFDRYVSLTELRLDDERRGRAPFLWVDRLAVPERHMTMTTLEGGEVVVSRMETRDRGHAIPVPGALVHHWVGTVFLPSVGVDRVVRLMQSYDAYQEIYRPAVQRSRLVSRDGARFTVALRLSMKRVVTVVLDTDQDVCYLRISPARIQVRSASTRIVDASQVDNGFLWRFNNYCALDERGTGTYVQCESVSLSRSIPIGLGWLIEPFVTSIPRESLEFTLAAMRRALVS